MSSFLSRCRLCGKMEGSIKFTNIFDGDFSEKVNKLLPIVVMHQDPLPKGVCITCFTQVNNMNQFYDHISSTDRFLRHMSPMFPKYELHVVDPILKIAAFHNSEHFMKILIQDEKPLGLDDKECEIIETTKQDSSCSNVDRIGTSSYHEKEGSTHSSPGIKSSTSLASKFIIIHVAKQKDVYTCRSCLKTFTTTSSAQAHPCERPSGPCALPTSIKQPSPVLTSIHLQCPDCNKQYKDKTNLLAHIWKMHKRGPSPVLLPQGERKRRKLDLNAEKERLKCGECKIHFPDKELLEDHIKTHEQTAANNNVRSNRVPLATPADAPHGTEDKQNCFYTCNCCDKFFSTRFNLEMHKWSSHASHPSNKPTESTKRVFPFETRQPHLAQMTEPANQDTTDTDSELEIIEEVHIKVTGTC